MSLVKSVGAGEQSTGFYNLLIDQSLKFNDGDNQFLTRTPSTSNQRTWTWSGWIKRGNLGSSQGIFGTDTSSTANFFLVQWTSSDTIFIQSLVSSSETIRLGTTRLFRDPSAWYHIVIAVDTTQGTASNRLKLYINGVQETDFSSGNATYPNSQNLDTLINNSSYPLLLGAYDVSGTPDTLDGYLAEINFIDGTALTAASFGETVQGIWTPKDTSGLTFGTNGFHLTFKDDVVSEGFNTVTYTGTGSAQQSISGIGFSPALVWVKSRNATRSHMLTDSVRGRAKSFAVETTNTEYSSAAGRDLVSFDGDGFTVGNPENFGSANTSGDDIAAWCWEGGGTPTADNSAGAGATPTAGSVKIDGSNLSSALAGSIPATRLTANTTNGFSVVTYTGTGSVGTIAHGLGATPKWMIIKNRGVGTWFDVYHTSLGATKYVRLNSNVAQQTNSNVFNDTEPTSSVFTVATVNDVNASGNTYVAYCWTDISGYSKFGTWQNNNSTTGTQVTGLGFKPAWMMVKDIDAGETWYILDNTRQPTNVSPPSTKFLIPNANSAEGSNNASTATIDFQDDGFQIKTTNPASGEISYGTRNYIYMAFADTREAAFFKDVTTNGNHFTPVNLDYRDSVPDVPTNNFATLNPLSSYSTIALSEGNLKASESANVGRTAFSSIALQSGKWYFEAYVQTAGTYVGIGLSDDSYTGSSYTGDSANSYGYLSHSGNKYNNGAAVGYGATFTAGDIVSAAFDVTTGTLTFYKNGVSQGTAFTSISLEQFFTVTSRNGVIIANFGQDSSFSGAKSTANSNADANGHGSFAYAPPSGFLALCSQNLPEPSILNSTEYFNTVLYTGNNGNLDVTGVGFDPDFVWAKNRVSSSYHHDLYDSVRGNNLRLNSSQTAAEATGFLTFETDGFSLTQGGGINANNNAHVAWNWLAGGTPTATNSAAAGAVPTSGSVMIDGVASTSALAGAIPATKISANTAAGFSIVSYTGNGSTNQTIAHGLSSPPQLTIIKDRDSNSNNNQWQISSSVIGDDYVYFTTAKPTGTAGAFPTYGDATTLTIGRTGNNVLSTNESGDDFIMYNFHSVEGYSKVATYTGNGSSDGTFVYTGFRPAFTIIKRVDANQKWGIQDAVREPSNEVVKYLEANGNYAEVDNYLNMDYLSNGFKLRRNEAATNVSGGTYFYIAFAENPFKFANAR